MENEFFLDTDDLFTDEIALRLRKTAPAKPEKRWVPAYYFDICLRDGKYPPHAIAKAPAAEVRKAEKENTIQTPFLLMSAETVASI